MSCLLCRVLAELCCAESFTEAAVHYLSVLWDQEEDEVLNKLEELGWTELTGRTVCGCRACACVLTQDGTMLRGPRGDGEGLIRVKGLPA